MLMKRFLAGARQVVGARKLERIGRTHLDARTAEAALGEVQLELGHRLPFLPFALDSIDDDAIAGAGFFAGLARDTEGIARGGIADEHDVPAKARGHLERFVRIMHRHSRLEELPQGDAHPGEQTLKPIDDLPGRMFHGQKIFIIALVSNRMNMDRGMRIFQERLSSP
jgi:hypothetical protein